MLGGADNDILVGEGGKDRFGLPTVEIGNDVLFGGAGNDLFRTNPGVDVCDGGAGGDVFEDGGAPGQCENLNSIP